jgi:hypothetical protein
LVHCVPQCRPAVRISNVHIWLWVAQEQLCHGFLAL